MCAYSTHSHRPDKPRLRFLLPTSREVTPDEYPAIARRVAQMIGIETMDPTTYQPARLMYWPSHSRDAEYLLFDEVDFDIDSVARRIGAESDLSDSARREIAVVAKDRYLGKTSDITCAEQGWKYRRYHERLMQLKHEMRRKYTKL